MFSFDFTVSGQDSNSYVSLLEADSYFVNHKHKDLWANEINKEYYLMEATRDVDSKPYKSIKKVKEQSLKFPRKINDIIPIDIKKAVLEQAIFLIRNEQRESHLDLQANGINSVNEANVSFNYSGSRILCENAERYVSKFIVGTARL